MRTGLPLREITTKELYKEIQQLRQELLNHNHLTSGSQQLTGEVTGILQSPNFITGSSGWQLLPDGTIEANKGYFRGDISGATGTFTGGLAVGTSPNWFKVDSDGNIWSGDATLAGAKTNAFAVEKEGLLYCKGATIDGTSTIGGRVASTIASAIDSSGHFIDSRLDTSTKEILGDFTFGYYFCYWDRWRCYLFRRCSG